MVEAISRPDMIAPHSLEAEESVIGSVLINASAYVDVAAFLHEEDFFIVKCGWIWAALSAVADRHDAIDNLTVVEELRTRDQLDLVGGMAYIAYLMNNTPTHIHAETYGRVVQRAAIRRRLLNAAGEIAQTALEEDLEIDDVLDKCDKSLFSVTARERRGEMVPSRKFAGDYFNRIEHLYRHPDETLGLPTGFKDLDFLLKGLRKTHLNLVAARPAIGKTALMTCIAHHAALHHQARVVIFSLEMEIEEINTRLLAIETDIPTDVLESGQLDSDQWRRFVDGTARISQASIAIDDSGAATPKQIRAKLRQYSHEFGLDLVVIDYLQLLKADTRTRDRVEAVTEISRELKLLAREFRVPFLVASQLNRQSESRADKRPTLSDVRDSGSLEQDANRVMLLYRDDMVNDYSERPNQCDVIVAKNRNGPTGTATLWYKKGYTKFYDMSYKEVFGA